MNLEKNPKIRHIAKKLLQLEDKFRGRPFPAMARVKEISNYSCGPATLEMLLSFVGYKVSQTKIIKSIRAQARIKLYGITVDDMAKAVKAAGKKELVLWKKHKASINDIAKIIDKFSYPVGVEWQGDFYENQDEDLGHYAVATKVNKKAGYLRMADPYFNSFFGYKDLDRKYKIADFVKEWWDTNEIKVTGTSKRRAIRDDRVIFVVTPKGDSWPKKVGMTRVK